MRRKRKMMLAVAISSLLLGGVVLWLNWPSTDGSEESGAANPRCAAASPGEMPLAPELECSGFSQLPSTEAFGTFKDAPKAFKPEFWGDADGRKVAVSSYDDGIKGDNESGSVPRYVGVFLPDSPVIWCSPDGAQMPLGPLLGKAAAVQFAVATGAATVDSSSGEVTSERTLRCFEETPS